MKNGYKKAIFWTTVAIVPLGISVFTLSALNPTNVAETSPEHKDERLRTRRYNFNGDLKIARKSVEEIILTLKTSVWGGNWKLGGRQKDDSSENLEIVRAEVPVIFFTDDLRIELKRENDKLSVDVHSKSRVGKSDFGENRCHILQFLDELDEKFNRV